MLHLLTIDFDKSKTLHFKDYGPQDFLKSFYT